MMAGSRRQFRFRRLNHIYAGAKRQPSVTDVTTLTLTLMKTRNTPSMLVALLLAFLALGATKAQAIIIIGGRSEERRVGKKCRVRGAKTGKTDFIIDGSKFFDSDGNVLAKLNARTLTQERC